MHLYKMCLSIDAQLLGENEIRVNRIKKKIQEYLQFIQPPPAKFKAQIFYHLPSCVVCLFKMSLFLRSTSNSLHRDNFSLESVGHAIKVEKN